MPLEVRQLVVKTTVDENESKKENKEQDDCSDISSEGKKNQIIDECLERVREMLEREYRR